MPDLSLYEFAISGNCHKVRLLLSFLNLQYQSFTLDAKNGEHKTPDYLQLNPLGQVPVLVDGNEIIRDSQAILVYLARKYGAVSWLPLDAVPMARVASWLSLAANEVARGLAALRSHYLLGRPVELDQAKAFASSTLRLTESQLEHSTWLAGNSITIADIAMYPYVALAHQGNIDLAEFPQTRRWLEDFSMQRGFVTMPGIP